jgi:hypothetical protein
MYASSPNIMESFFVKKIHKQSTLNTCLMSIVFVILTMVSLYALAQEIQIPIIFIVLFV